MGRKSDRVNQKRRELLAGAGALGLAGMMPTSSTVRADGAPAQAAGAVSVANRGKYATVPLRQDSINVTAIQSRVRSVDVRNLKPTLQANLDHALHLIDVAQGSPAEWGGERLWGAKQDLVCMHEFPIQGFQPWTRTELNKVAFDLDGPEVAAIGERAKRYGCYIAFGCYAKEKDWPRHVINMSVIVGPTGEVVARHWKARNMLGLFGENALIGTTVYDVLDRYVEMYGWDAVLPVARTDIGNIAMTAVGMEPLLYQCLALKGAEILVMSVTGGSNAETATATAHYNRIYTVGVCNSVSPDNLGFTEAAGAEDEGTVIVDPRGTVLAKTSNHHEDTASTRIPIGDFRKTRRMAEVPVALLRPVLDQYEPVFQPNAFLNELPETYKDAGALVRKRMQGS
jgi:predicted amidohydrolase